MIAAEESDIGVRHGGTARAKKGGGRIGRREKATEKARIRMRESG